MTVDKQAGLSSDHCHLHHYDVMNEFTKREEHEMFILPFW